MNSVLDPKRFSSFRPTPRKVPLLLTALFGLILSVLYGTSTTTLFYAFETSEYLNRLFAHADFVGLLESHFVSFLFPWQHLNILSVCFIRLTDFLHWNHVWLLAAAQIGLAGLFLHRTHILLEDELKSEQISLYFVLLVCHPLFWIALTTQPSLVLTTWLLIESLLILPRLHQFPHRGFVVFLALSLSGPLGFLSALVLCLCSLMHGWRSQTLFMNSSILPALAVLPSFLLYGFLSFHSGILGGPYLSNVYALFAPVSFAILFNGQWTIHFQDNLLALGHGFLEWPIHFPLLGFFSFIGILHLWQSKSVNRVRYHSVALMLGITLILSSFSTSDFFRSAGFLLLPFLLWFLLVAIESISRYFGRYHVWFNLFLVLTLAFLSLSQFPSRWEPVFHRAVYYENISYTLLNNLDLLKDQEGNLPDPFPVRFSSPLYANLPILADMYPFDFALYTKHPNHANSSYGIHIDFPFETSVEYFIGYPLYEEAKTHGIDVLPEVFHQQWIEHEYEHFQIQNVTFFSKRDIPYREEQLPLGHPVGEQWTFESPTNISTTGLAFGSIPDTSRHQFGMAAAGPGRSDAVKSLGTLASDIFVLEGDELHVAAHLPKHATHSLVCMAVYDSKRYGSEGGIRTAKHIYEHVPHEPLMKDVFYYIDPSSLEYTPGWIQGWRVVRILRSGMGRGWQRERWSLDAWRNQQARWLAADRDPDHGVWIDQITQHQRPPGYYWNFEDGTYQGWQQTGNAWGDTPAQGAFGDQNPIYNSEGNFLINTYYGGSDWPIGVLSRSTPSAIEINLSHLSFLIGGGEDLEKLYVALVVNGTIVKKATGRGKEHMRRVIWDITPWVGEVARIQIVDRSSEPWGHLLVDDIRMYEDQKKTKGDS